MARQKKVSVEVYAKAPTLHPIASRLWDLFASINIINHCEIQAYCDITGDYVTPNELRALKIINSIRQKYQ